MPIRREEIEEAMLALLMAVLPAHPAPELEAIFHSCLRVAQAHLTADLRVAQAHLTADLREAWALEAVALSRED